MIERKSCKCGCGRMPTMSFGGWFYLHAPEEIKLEQGVKAKKRYQANANRQRLGALSRKVRGLENKKEAASKALKTLMAIADEKFSLYIRNRDAVMGKVKCVCCGNVHGLKDKDSNGDTIIQCLHFVSRKVYSKRYSEFTCHAGCSWCNKNMNDEPTGLAYKRYRDFLVSRSDEFTISQIENERYKVNRISHSDLETIIRKYSK
jgi:Bacteriophage Lambda NinG protein